ncbi:MAG TPA: hydroxymethylbilane synthase [Pyrinomonadaceae bacterium]
MRRKFIIGSRGSRLALWQTKSTKAALEARFPQHRFEIRIIHTKGDKILDTALSKIGDKGLFTKEIENALLGGEIDLAVHSLKDLPTTQPAGLKIGAVSERETPNDAFISKNFASLDELPEGARVATGSLRRRSQLLAYRPDLEIVEIRGNVPTRLEKLFASDLDGMILAFAGVHRLGLDAHIRQIVPTEILLPAVGQGVMAVEIRAADAEIAAMLAEIDDRAARSCVTAERAFLRRLEGGCQVPIGALARLENDEIFLQGFVGDTKGAKVLRDSIRGAAAAAASLGDDLAEKVLAAGAAEILREARADAAQSAGEVV